ncbi:hypothetical protein HYV57_04400 [Candidatus Peregrinibacteria bacterium]|nr:hypothetical protein [Candidatus Peregrinibacteria bacterium]
MSKNTHTDKKHTDSNKYLKNYFVYIDSIMNGLKLSPAMTEQAKLQVRQMVEDMVDDRIMETIISLFGKEEYDAVDEILRENLDIDENEALFIVADTISELPEYLTKTLESMKEEFLDYGYLNESVLHDNLPS